ncbi:hypothetical protein HOLleu_40189 [Holothuria leucospilota]|uniref:Uncharacterized protein n=1 Tax=Holothuria leucospilota TaxID=206669 RepID=A0A9Q0YHF2_HOLLE|nr:hypothetical protein HOLleu_40189 [Holothuria leucospilota]
MAGSMIQIISVILLLVILAFALSYGAGEDVNISLCCTRERCAESTKNCLCCQG